MKKSILNSKTRKEIDELAELMMTQTRFLMLSGGIAVGKTMYAERIAAKIICGDNIDEDLFYNHKVLDEKLGEQRELIVLHPGRTYDNLIYGVSVFTKDGELNFKSAERDIVEFCKKAKKASEKKNENYVLILDDIHRIDMSYVLGDLFTALDKGVMRYEKHEETHTSVEYVQIPDNLYIIATINPLLGKETFDYAWMRRFYVYDLWADSNYIRECCPEEQKKKDGRIEIGKEKEFEEYKFDDIESFFRFRNYQWEIYRQIEIMYERYCMYPEKIRLYMPGHGLFCYDEGECEGERYFNFHRRIRTNIYPLISYHLQQGILKLEAELDIMALGLLGNEIKDEDIINNFCAPSKTYVKKGAELINEKQKRFAWNESYLFIFHSIYMYEDCNEISTMKNCFCVEDYNNRDKCITVKNANKNPNKNGTSYCHVDNVVWKIGEVGFSSLNYLSNSDVDRPYFVYIIKHPENNESEIYKEFVRRLEYIVYLLENRKKAIRKYMEDMKND